MPHITVEVPAPLARQINWRRCFANLHRTLDENGYGRLQDFKSRVIVVDEWLIADADASASFVFATLQTMNARPPEMLRAMADIVHQGLEHELKALAAPGWIQCCVRVASTPAEDYFKSHLNPPPLKEGLFKVGES